MNALFVDTSGLYATLDRDDEFHAAAAQFWRDALAGDRTLLTTNYVMVETLALCQHRLGLPAARAVADDVAPALVLEWIRPEDHQAALQSLLAANRRQLSFVDCTSFVIMRRLGLKSVFTFDSHFRQQGFDVAPE